MESRCLGTEEFDISDRMHGEVKRFTRYGHYLYGVKFPTGSLPCNIDYLGSCAVVAALDGPDPRKAHRSTYWKTASSSQRFFPRDDLGLENFKHIHNAVLRELNGKYYIIVQSWNPGGFAILERVTA